jgi:hypothetical protein
VSLLKIREKELDFYSKNCSAIGTQAALLSGFAYSSILGMKFGDDIPISMQLLYTSVTACAMTVEILALVSAARPAADRRSPARTAALAAARLFPHLPAPTLAAEPTCSTAQPALPALNPFAPLRRAGCPPPLAAVQLDDVRDARPGPRAARSRRLDAQGGQRSDSGIQGLLLLLCAR